MITLVYGVYSGTSLTQYATTFAELGYYTAVETEREIGRTLRQIDFAHKFGSKLIHHLTISADELYNTTKFDFMKNFYKADKWWIGSSEVVLQDTGEMPVEHLEGNKHLPEVVLTFKDRGSS